MIVELSSIIEDVKVREIMSSPVIEANEEDSIQTIAEKMKKYHIGSIVIMRNGKPVGIITKRDLIDKVIAENKLPSQVKAKEIMSSPVYEASPDDEISKIVRKMNELKVSRLIVTYKGKLVGIVSLKDVLQVTPEIIDLIREKIKLAESAIAERKKELMEGYCDSCGEWSDSLSVIDGQFLCEECRIEIEKGKRGVGIEEEESE
ncbi:MAG: CBS domain-containing protein [Nitrososphaerota archaeon]